VTNPTSSQHTAPGPRFFALLEHDDFLRLEHAAYLKGLLKPFKGKGDLEFWASQCESLREAVIALAQRLLAQATVYPFSLLPVVLAQQSTGAGTALRWRNADRSAMGVALWTQLMAQPTTPLPLVHGLFALEQQRITLNMQISLLHTLARQARDAAAKLAHAEAAYQQRIDRHASTPPQESRV
jgi:Protein of unknown function (DUF3158)